ncbi:hypothetical protein N9887_01185 [Flavobacteriaceae bacterium]|nr:hypothetical protein [Flavobacteriaceae bacterium]
MFSSEEEDLLRVRMKKFKPYTKNKFDKSILLKTIFKIHNDMTGDIAEKLKMLYIELELVDESIKKIKSSKWHIQIIGMRELSDMRIKDVADDIGLLSLNKNEILRREAQLALVKINGFQALDFLNNLTYTLSEWQQLLLLETIQYFNENNLPPLEPLLKSENDSVVLFVLKICTIFNLIRLKDNLIQLLNHENEQLRIEAIEVIGELQITDSLAILKIKYAESTKPVQLKIIELFGKIADKTSIPYLAKKLQLYDYETNLQVLRAINSIEGKQKLEELKSSLTSKQQNLLLHVIEENK